MKQWVSVGIERSGSPYHGYVVHGPFLNEFEAIVYAKAMTVHEPTRNWSVAQVTSPSPQAEE